MPQKAQILFFLIFFSVGEIQKLDSQRFSARDTFEQLKLDITALQNELDNAKESLEEKVTEKKNPEFISIKKNQSLFFKKKIWSLFFKKKNLEFIL